MASKHVPVRVIGLRAEPKGFFWAVSHGTQEVPVVVGMGYVEAPKTFSFPQGVNFLRSRFLQLITEFKIDNAGLRTPEMVRTQNEAFRQRLRVESVLLAASSEAGIKIIQGPLATLGRLLGVKSAKTLLDSDDYCGINLEKMPTPKREAILMSVSLLKAENADSN